jgi:Flp pilus assembly protein TadG
MLRKFFADRRGNVATTFAIAALPLLAAMGAAVDYSNSYDERQTVQDALDSAVLAAGKKIGILTTDQVKAEAQNFYTTNIAGKLKTPPVMTTSVTASTIVGTAQLHVPTYFLGIVGLKEIVFNVKATATLAMGTLEVVMALDNSGSMAGSKISTLITAAGNLTDTLYGLAATSTKPDPIKVGLVPFASSVKVDPAHRTSGWMDTTGIAPYNGESFEGSTGSPPVSNNTPAAVNVFSLYDSMSGSANAWAGCVEERKAPYDVTDDPASTSTPATMFVPMFAPDEPDSWTCTTSNGCAKACTSDPDGSSCSSSSAGLRYNGAPTGSRSYNNYLPDAGTTASCGGGLTVTMTKASPAVFTTSSNHGLVAGQRIAFTTTGGLYSGLTAGTTYYVLSTGLTSTKFRVSATNGGTAINTSGSQSGTHSVITSPDWTCANGNTNCATSAGISQQSALLGQNVSVKNLCKYGTPTNKVTPASITVGNYGGTYNGGPNYNCTTDPVVPLTVTKSTVKTAIGNMAADGTTNITAGLMWGWRLLSPTAPFTEGRAYSVTDNQKILVLMTDGENTYFGDSKFTVSTYGAWGYIWKSHLGTTSSNEDDMQEKMEERMALACTNIKAAKIKIYTVAFQVTDETTLGLLSSCATKTSMAYQSSDNASLLAAFTAIGNDITLLRVSE